MKKIIIFNAGSSLYGAGRGLINLVKALEDNFEITVVLSKKGPLTRRLRKLSPRVSIKLFPLPVLIFSVSPFYLLKFMLLSLINFFYFIFYIKNNEIDIVFTNNLLLLFPALVARLVGKKHIWYVREFFNYRFINRIIGIYVREFSSSKICQSKAIKEELYLKSNVKIIYEPLADDYKVYGRNKAKEELSLPFGSVVVAIISRIHPLKGQYEFLRSAKDIFANNNYILLIVGDAVPNTFKNFLYKKRIESFISKNSLANVRLLGFREDIDKILSASDICVFPFKRKEPFGIAVAEALSFGKKAFYPKSGGLKEVYEIFGSGEDLTAEGVLKALSGLENKRPGSADKLYIPDALCFKVYKAKIIDIVGLARESILSAY